MPPPHPRPAASALHTAQWRLRARVPRAATCAPSVPGRSCWRTWIPRLPRRPTSASRCVARRLRWRAYSPQGRVCTLVFGKCRHSLSQPLRSCAGLGSGRTYAGLHIRTHLGTAVDTCPRFRYFLQASATADVCLFRVLWPLRNCALLFSKNPPAQSHVAEAATYAWLPQHQVQPNRSAYEQKFLHVHACTLQWRPVSTYATAARLSVYAYFCICIASRTRRLSTNSPHCGNAAVGLEIPFA
jgi:hypothetical protein